MSTQQADTPFLEMLQKRLSPFELTLVEMGLRTPKAREVIREEKRKKDKEAVDELCRMVESEFIPQRGDQDHEYLEQRWRRVYRKMKEAKDILEEKGSVHKTERADGRDRYEIRFRRMEDGKRVQSGIYLGTDRRLMLAALRVLQQWRTGYENDVIEDESSCKEGDPIRNLSG